MLGLLILWDDIYLIKNLYDLKDTNTKHIQAKIIHMNRNPMATCWSIYKRFFSDIGNGCKIFQTTNKYIFCKKNIL